MMTETYVAIWFHYATMGWVLCYDDQGWGEYQMYEYEYKYEYLQYVWVRVQVPVLDYYMSTSIGLCVRVQVRALAYYLHSI